MRTTGYDLYAFTVIVWAFAAELFLLAVLPTRSHRSEEKTIDYPSLRLGTCDSTNMATTTKRNYTVTLRAPQVATGRYYFRISYALDGVIVDCRTGWVFDKKDGRSVSEQALETARSDAKLVSKPIVGTPVSVHLTQE